MLLHLKASDIVVTLPVIKLDGTYISEFMTANGARYGVLYTSVGVLDYGSGQIVWRKDEPYTAKTFLAFLLQVVAAYPTGTITMVLDNARIHHAKLLQRLLADHRRLTFVFLPPCSPQLNIVEGLWKRLKSDVINNVFYHTSTTESP